MLTLKLKLTDLDPRFLKCTSPGHYDHAADIAEAEGLMFLCPACFWSNEGAVGTHAMIVWRPVPGPCPGFDGTGYADLSLKAGSSPVHVRGGCKAHFYIKGGRVDFC